MNETAPRRLDSWKAIADYLGRDVATVRRWEKSVGLPVHRVPGGRGHSVFAFVSEIDAWLALAPPKPQSDGGLPAPSPAAEPVVPPSLPPSVPVTVEANRRTEPRRWHVAVGVAVVLVTGAAWGLGRPRSNAAVTTVRATPDGVQAIDAAGRTRWTHSFDPADQTVFPDERSDEAAVLFDRDRRSVLYATSFSIRKANKNTRSGEIVLLSPEGSIEHRVSIDDELSFGSTAYAGPWTISDFRVEDGPLSRIAVAAHHYQWWPSVVTLLDPTLKRQGSFVHAGWVQRVHWLSSDRLLIGGFSNERDGAMLALVDLAGLNGQGPVGEAKYRCTSCGAGTPARYVVLPRSELNRVTASPFNRIVVEITPGGLSARTIEVPALAQPADVLYEFTADLEITRATYSDRYWEMHRALEASGRLTHTRQACPDRDGPPSAQVWDPTTGWRTIPLPR